MVRASASALSASALFSFALIAQSHSPRYKKCDAHQHASSQSRRHPHPPRMAELLPSQTATQGNSTVQGVTRLASMSSTIASISTAAPKGRPEMQMAERACAPASPITCFIRSV